MKNQVILQIERADPTEISVLEAAGVSTVHEAIGQRGLLAPYMRPIFPGASIAGSAVTVLSAPGDNLMIHAAVEACQAGDVLVVGVSSASTDGMFGELLATSLRARGVVGLIIDAGVRDVAQLSEVGFPVWSKAISAQGTVKATPGSVNVPIVCAGALISPGDVIVADDDGVVCIERRDVPVAAAASLEREVKEASTRAALAEGVLGVDLYGLRAVGAADVKRGKSSTSDAPGIGAICGIPASARIGATARVDALPLQQITARTPSSSISFVTFVTAVAGSLASSSMTSSI